MTSISSSDKRQIENAKKANHGERNRSERRENNQGGILPKEKSSYRSKHLW